MISGNQNIGELKLENISPIHIPCHKCGHNNPYYTIPIDDSYKCRWCAPHSQQIESDWSWIFGGSDGTITNTRINRGNAVMWLGIIGIVVLGGILGWYITTKFKKKK